MANILSLYLFYKTINWKLYYINPNISEIFIEPQEPVKLCLVITKLLNDIKTDINFKSLYVYLDKNKTEILSKYNIRNNACLNYFF